MRRYIILLTFFVTGFGLQAQNPPQIGFQADGTARFDVHPAAAVEIRSGRKGVILPSLTARQRESLPVDKFCPGLTVYQTDSQPGLYAWNGTEWEYLNPAFQLADSGGQLRFSKVAMTGSYNDLLGRPALPGGDGDYTLSPVAYTGNYHDLTHQPDIPKALQGLKPIALSGSYRDLRPDLGVPEVLADLENDEFYQTVTEDEMQAWTTFAETTFPTELRELEQDSLHRLVTAEQKNTWNAYTQKTIPSSLRDLQSDDYYTTVSLSDRQKWDRQARTPVPARVADLQQDEWAQTASDADIARWDSAAARFIPTAIRELEEDETHRSITAQQYNRWTTHAEKMNFSGNYADLSDLPEIPRHLSQFATDIYNKVISREERSLWDSAASRRIPTRLSELKDDNLNYRLVSQTEIRHWDTMSSKEIPDYSRHDARTFIEEGDPGEMDHYRALSDFGVTGMWSKLSGRPTLSEGTAPVTGNYNDLDDVGRLTYLAITTGVLNTLQYRDLLDKPDLKSDFITGGEAAALNGLPEDLSDFTEDGMSRHISQTRQTLYNTSYKAIMEDGITNSASNPVVGAYRDLRFNSDMQDGFVLEGSPTISGTSFTDLSVATVGYAKTLDNARKEGVRKEFTAIPDNLIMMYVGDQSILNKVDVYGGCWKRYTYMEGRFPVGSVDYPAGSEFQHFLAAGEKEVTLTESQLPAHRHSVGYETFNSREGDDKNDNPRNHGMDSDFGTEKIGNMVQPAGGIEQSDGSFVTLPHNNIPPFYTVMFIEYSKGCK